MEPVVIHLPVLVVLLNVLLLMGVAIVTGRARARHGLLSEEPSHVI